MFHDLVDRFLGAAFAAHPALSPCSETCHILLFACQPSVSYNLLGL